MRDYFKNLKITKNNVRFIIGIFICLFSCYLALNLANVPNWDYFIYISKFFTWITAFFVGSLFTYLVYLILFLYGLSLIFYTKRKKFHFDIWILGVVLFVLGVMIIVSNAATITTDESGTITKYLTFTNFTEIFNNTVLNSSNFPNISLEKNSGLIGMLFTAIINSGMTYIGSYIIGSVLLSIGAVFLLYKPVIKFFYVAKDYRQINIHSAQTDYYSQAKDVIYTTTTINSLEETEVPNIEVNQEGNVDIVDQEKIIQKIEEANIQEETYKRENKSVYVPHNHNEEILTKAKFRVVDEYYTDNVLEDNFQETSNFQPVSTPKLDEDFSNKYKHMDPQVNFVELTPVSPIDIRKELESAPEREVIKKKKEKIIYTLPSIDLLVDRKSQVNSEENEKICKQRTEIMNQAFIDYNLHSQIVGHTIGPSVTRYDIEIESRYSIKDFDKYMNDISRRLDGAPARLVPIVTGKSTSGIEIPNKNATMVNFKDCLKHLNDKKAPYDEFCCGKDISGNFVDLSMIEEKHLMVAGTTGSGKTVFIHSVLMSFLMRSSPDSLKIILIDPKQVEFTKYNEVPHLMCPPLVDVDIICDVMEELCKIMDDRYSLLRTYAVDSLDAYNKVAKEKKLDILPIIVVVVDEFADLVNSNRKIADYTKRIAQKARAAGINLIVATQRPSVDVLDGVLKGNIATRVGLYCASGNDSSVILDSVGAEKLLGNGDMLVKSPVLARTSRELTRVQGSFVSKQEISNVCDWYRSRYPKAYDERIMRVVEKPIISEPDMLSGNKNDRYTDDDLYNELVQYTMGQEYISIAKICSAFSMGYPKAKRFSEKLKADGIIDDVESNNNARGIRVIIHNEKYNISKARGSENRGSTDVSTLDPSKKET